MSRVEKAWEAGKTTGREQERDRILKLIEELMPNPSWNVNSMWGFNQACVEFKLRIENKRSKGE